MEKSAQVLEQLRAVVLEQLRAVKKRLESTTTLLKEIGHLEQSLPNQLPKFKAKLDQLNKAVDALGQYTAHSLYENLCALVGQYRDILLQAQEDLKKQLGVALQRELEEKGFSLSGHYPDLRVGLFTLEVNFDSQRAILWYGPKQERLAQCQLGAQEITGTIQKAFQQLGSQLEAKDFIEKLKQAYIRARKNQTNDRVPIIEVLSELAYVLQSSAFHLDPRRENYRGYSRADFSFDLFRMREVLRSAKLKLVVATRAYTRQRRDFLWVPDNDQGQGTFYSHLQLGEEIT